MKKADEQTRCQGTNVWVTRHCAHPRRPPGEGHCPGPRPVGLEATHGTAACDILARPGLYSRKEPRNQQGSWGVTWCAPHPRPSSKVGPAHRPQGLQPGVSRSLSCS